MRVRPTPSFLIAVLALVVALGSASYAAITVGSAQIKNNSVQSEDIKNRTIVGKDVKKKSLPSNVLKHACRKGERRTLGMCMAKKASGPSSYAAAVSRCDKMGGRLPTLGELDYIASLSGITWADGQANSYEYTGTHWQANSPTTPTATDRGGNVFDDANGQSFWHRCLRLP